MSKTAAMAVAAADGIVKASLCKTSSLYTMT